MGYLLAKVCSQAVATRGCQDSGLVHRAPRRPSWLACAGGFWSAAAPSGPSRPLVRSRLSTSAIVPSACHSSKRRRQVGGEGYRPGNVAHPRPDASAHKTPFKIPRAFTRGRPPRPFGTRPIWNKASTSAHSMSVKSSTIFIPFRYQLKYDTLHRHQGIVQSSYLDIRAAPRSF
jgi:hypothetical protein